MSMTLETNVTFADNFSEISRAQFGYLFVDSDKIPEGCLAIRDTDFNDL